MPTIWNKDVFYSIDNVDCPITSCTQYLPGCNTPMTGLSNMMFLKYTPPDLYYVCYQDEGKDMEMIWKNFKDEKEAKELYETFKGKKKASMLYYAAAVVEQDGDTTLTDSMKTYADKTYPEDKLKNI